MPGKKQSFWSDDAVALLEAAGRRDLVDKGDALAQRVAALLLTAADRLRQYTKYGDLYNGRGGASALGSPDAVGQLEDFVNRRLRQEIAALEKVLKTFEDLRGRGPSDPGLAPRSPSLPDWY